MPTGPRQNYSSLRVQTTLSAPAGGISFTNVHLAPVNKSLLCVDFARKWLPVVRSGKPSYLPRSKRRVPLANQPSTGWSCSLEAL